MDLEMNRNDVILKDWAFEGSQFRGFYHVILDSTVNKEAAIKSMLELGFKLDKVHHDEHYYSYVADTSPSVLQKTHPYMEYLNRQK